MNSRTRNGMIAGIILLLLFLACMIRAVNNDLCRRAMVQKSFDGAMTNDVDSGTIGGAE